MLNDQQIQYYKEENSDGHRLFYVRFADKEFIFRTISIKEYEFIKNTYTDRFKQENAICNISCVYPDEYDFSECEYGVLPSVMSGYIVKYSSLDSPLDAFKEYEDAKADMSNMFQQCMDLVKAFIGDYTYEEMEEWTWQKLMTMTVRAEKIAKYKGFDYHLEKLGDEPPKPTIHNEEHVNAILKNKINPLIYFKDELEEERKLNYQVVNTPFVIGINWNTKELLDGFRKQKIKEE